MVTFGKPEIFLAPMEGITDGPMRAFQTELGGITLCVTEFIRVSQSPLPAKVFKESVPEYRSDFKTPMGTAVIVQLLGGDPERVAESALTAVKLGARGIDLNFGCPAPTVNRHDGGATLLKFPERLKLIVSAVRKAVPEPIPVSSKLRLGWDSIDAIDQTADAAIEGGSSWVTIHARTRMAGYTPPVYWEPVARVRRRSPIPVVANGDLWSVEDVKRCHELTGCEHFMLGRGTLADPLLALKVLGYLTGNFVHDSAEFTWPQWIERFIEVASPYANNTTYIAKRLKQWLKYAHLRGTFSGFDEIKRLNTHHEILKGVTRIYENRIYRLDELNWNDVQYGTKESQNYAQPTP